MKSTIKAITDNNEEKGLENTFESSIRLSHTYAYVHPNTITICTSIQRIFNTIIWSDFFSFLKIEIYEKYLQST